MREKKRITLQPNEMLTIEDPAGNEIILVDFENDPGAHLLSVYVYDTDGRPLAQLGVDYLGAGYPQGGAPGNQLFVNQVMRSTLPARSMTQPHPITEGPKEAPGRRAELDPDHPLQKTWCRFAGEDGAGDE